MRTTFFRRTVILLAAFAVTPWVHGAGQGGLFGNLFGGQEQQDVGTQEPDSEGDTPASPLEELAQKDISKSRSRGQQIGGAVATVLGAVLSKDIDNRAVRTIAIAGSAGLGVHVGGRIGEEMGKRAADRRLAYAKEHDFLESEIEASERAIAMRELELEEADATIEHKQARIAELQEREHLTREQLAEARTLKQDLISQVEENQELMVSYEEKLTYLTHVLETSEAEADATEEERDLHRERYASLVERKDQLLAQYQGLQQRNEMLAANVRSLEEKGV